MKKLAPLCFSFTISGLSPSPPRSPARSQPPYSRVETHGRRVTSWSPLGSRTEAKREKKEAEEEEGRKKKEKVVRILPPPRDGRVDRPTAASARCGSHASLNGDRARQPVRVGADVSVHVLKFPSFGCPPGDIKRELVQSQARLEDVYPRGGKGTGCCCYGNAAFCCCCPNLRML